MVVFQMLERTTKAWRVHSRAHTERGKEEILTGKERMKNKIVEREREERDRDRQSHGGTDRHAGRQRQRQTDRETDG